MAQDLTLAVRIVADAGRLRAEVASAGGALDQLGRQASGAGGGMGALGRGGDQAARDLHGLGDAGQGVARQLSALPAIIAGLGLASLARDVVGTADAWAAQTDRLRLVTKSHAELAQVQDRLFDLAQKTRSDMGATSDLYARLADATQSLSVVNRRIGGREDLAEQPIVADCVNRRIGGREVLTEQPPEQAEVNRRIGGREDTGRRAWAG
ncbi:MAG: hypothetical protein HQL40_15455 [Alphaproteobacteria bacterium]|nr:hypothetical protein [Alphaproteobacteria bacterium]